MKEARSPSRAPDAPTRGFTPPVRWSARVALTLDGPTLRRALNAVLPRTLRVLDVEDRPDGFHARFSAQSKTYEYRIVNGPVASPFSHRFAWHVPYRVEVARMQEAARLLEGTHDFSAFRSTGTDVHNTMRTILRSVVECRAARGAGLVDIALPGGTVLVYEVTGTGFLRHMVRAIVGTLVEIGAGRMTPADLRAFFDRGRRDAAGPTAPAAGLCLARVDYGEAPPPVAAQR